MVSRTETAPARFSAGRGRQKKTMLRKKLLRDMTGNAMQFIAIVLLCALGTWIYSGLDGTWRMLDTSIESYFAQSNLTDFWVNGSSFSRYELSQLRHLEGVKAIQARTTMEFDAVGLGDDVSLEVHATDGDIAINVPLIKEGEMMRSNDLRGCMLDEQFALANDLHVGDSVTLDLLGQERTYTIRALVNSPEHVITAKDVNPDPAHYGFLIISSQSVRELPFTEVLIDLEDAADASAVEAAVSQLIPSALIVTQSTDPSTQRTRNDVIMFRSLSYVFPLLAFAVAAMIVLTTLTRMIENQRTQMGTLKALGYTDRQIRRHYLSYALYPSLVGALGGLIVGQYTLPYVLWNMEASIYVFPYQIQPPISLSAWVVTGLAVALSVAICLHTYNKAARETTASLLRPKPPQASSRILLERVTFLWRRFSFNSKMIVRNLFRNKWRTVMSLVGMLCCNMLIICTLGLQDSISASVSQYYGGALHYDLRADLEDGAGTLESYQARLGAEAERVEGIMEKSISLRANGNSRTTLLTVMEEDQTLISLGENHTLVVPPDDGVILSEKLTDTMGVKIGDSVEIWLPGETDALHVTVSAIVSTSFNQSVYIGRRQWESFHKGAFIPTALLFQSPTAMCLHRLEEMEEVTAFKNPEEQYEQTMTILESATTAFSIMSGAALGLAFIICYNMGLMNFTERTRDYATLKVLGYHQREIRGLMLRENNLTALLGVALGIPPGILLTRIILKTVETESSAYITAVAPLSILIASAVTFVFTFLIQLFLTRKVRSIDMVEALKSVE